MVPPARTLTRHSLSSECSGGHKTEIQVVDTALFDTVNVASLHSDHNDYKGLDVESDWRCVNSVDSDPHGLSPLRHGVAHLPGRLFEFRCVVRFR